MTEKEWLFFVGGVALMAFIDGFVQIASFLYN